MEVSLIEVSQSCAIASGSQIYRQQIGAAGGRDHCIVLRPHQRSALCVGLYDSPAYDIDVPALPVARLSLNFVASRVIGGIAGERPRDFASERYSLFLTPAGAEVRWRKLRSSRHINLYFHPQAFIQEGHEDLATTPRFNARVPGVQRLAEELAAELQRDDALALEAADCLGRLLLVRMLRHMEGRTALTRRELDRVRDFVMANLERRLLVCDLAKVVGLTPNRYAQAHLQLTGRPPHQFVLALRLQRAQDLLSRTDMALIDVAAACGFASQQHMTNTMRTKIGVTPARWRATHHQRCTPD